MENGGDADASRHALGKGHHARRTRLLPRTVVRPTSATMLLDSLLHQGATLYRWRSYLPLPLTLLLFAALALPPVTPEWHAGASWWDWLALSASLAGLAIRIHTIGHAPAFTSGGNVHKQVANELNMTGCYSIVRHPLYLGNLLMWLGPALFVRSPWLVLICLLAFWLYYERIMCAEEDFLATRFDTQFREWAGTTPAILPSLGPWKKPDSPFKARRVLRREYNALLATAALFNLLVLWRSWIHGPGLMLPTSWMLLLAAAILISLLCLFLKKRTSVLEVNPEKDSIQALKRTDNHSKTALEVPLK